MLFLNGNGQVGLFALLVHQQEQITYYFIERQTSGFVEGFNNREKVLKRRCYGLSGTIKLF
jgi:transposase